MKATVTNKGQITIPAEIRRRLAIKPGQVLNIDENALFAKTSQTFDEKKMRSVLGIARGKWDKMSQEWLNEMRGPVWLPNENGR